MAAALAPLAADLKSREARLDGRRGSDEDALDADLDQLMADHHRAETQVLQRLAGQGNAEAMFRLADLIRDSEDPNDVRRWFKLTTTASDLGHPGSDDELVRWYWHQRGEGGIAAVQRNRERALAYAGKAASEGDFYAISRIGVYVSGALHQYPANLGLGRKVLELCAEADSERCQAWLVSNASYDYGQSPAEAYFWIARLAQRDPDRLSAVRERTRRQLTAAQRQDIEQAAAAWRPIPWPSLEGRWEQLKAEIVREGAGSIGPDAPCGTATPWCRGQWLTASSPGPAHHPPIRAKNSHRPSL